MKLKYVYILGAGHSGSTLLELAVSNQGSVFATGELAHIHQVWRSNALCACGESVQTCPAWSDILAGWHDDDVQIIGALGYSARSKEESFITGFRDLYPLFLERLRHYSGCEIVTDSSKSLARLQLLSRVPGIDLRVLYLHRHIGGVALSNRRKGRRYHERALSWLLRGIFALNYLRESRLPWKEVSYERLVTNPESEMRDIYEFLDVDYDVNRIRNFSSVRHLVEGNRIRFDHQNLAFRPPSSWEQSFNKFEIAYFGAVNYLAAQSRRVLAC